MNRLVAYLPKSLRGRIMLLILTLGIMAAIINILIVGTFQYKFLKTSINSTVQNQIDTVSSFIAESLIYERIYDIYIRAESMKKVLNFVKNIYIFDAVGEYITDVNVEQSFQNLDLINDSDLSYRVFTINLGNERAGYIVYIFKDNYIANEVFYQLVETAFLGLILLFFGLLFAFIINRFMTEPLSYLTSEIEKGAFETFPFQFKLPVNSSTEIKLLASKIEELSLSLKKAASEIQEKEVLLQRSKRLASIGMLVAGLAHQLKNPIMTIQLISHIFKAGEVPNDKDISVIHKESEKIVETLDGFLNISKPIELNVSDINISLFKDMFVETGNTRTKSEIKISINFADEFTFVQDEARLKDVLLNLLHNSHEAGARNFTIAIDRIEQNIIFQVYDDGVVLSKDIYDKIFMPFFTTKVKGTGLGLSYVEYCLNAMGGNITYDESYKDGVKFIVTLKESFI